MTSTLVDDVRSWYAESPESVALVTASEILSVSDVVARASAVAGQLRAAKIARGSLVAISSDGPLEFIGLLAAHIIGAVSVITPSQSEFIDSGAPILVHDGREWADSSSIDVRRESRPWRDWLKKDGSDAPDQVVHVCLTSGTTGEPKLVEFTRDIVDKRTNGYVEIWPVRGSAALFRLSSIAGFGAAIAAMRVRTPYIPLTDLGTESLDIVGSTDVTALIGAPNQVLQLMTEAARHGLTITLDWIMTAGAPQTSTFVNALLDVVGTGRITNVYGSTECGTAAFSVTSSDSAFDGMSALSTIFEIVDESGARCEENVEGIVRYRTPAQCHWYRVGKTRIPISDEAGWFYPGDRGMITPAGEIRITGRDVDVINVGGAKVNPLEIERVVDLIEGVNDVACVALQTPDGVTHLALSVVVAQQSAYDSVVEFVNNRPRAGRPNIVIAIQSIPRNRNGKIMRAELSAALSNSLAAVQS